MPSGQGEGQRRRSRTGRGLPRVVAAVLLGVPLVLGLSLTVHGGPQDELTRRDYAIAGFKPPPRWEMLPRDRASYPQLLAWASRGQGKERSTITLVAKRLPPSTPLQVFAQEANGLRSRPRVQNMRVQVQSQFGWFGGQRVQVDAVMAPEAGERPQVLRQLFFMNPPFGYVLSLVAPQEQAAARYRDLDDTAANLSPLPTGPLPDLGVPAPPPDLATGLPPNPPL